MDLGEYPTINTEQGPDPLEGSILFFLNKEVLGACICFEDNIISIYSLCLKMATDLPYIEDVVYTIDHETIHWVLFEFIDCWASWCFDNVSGYIKKWITM